MGQALEAVSTLTEVQNVWGEKGLVEGKSKYTGVKTLTKSWGGE